LPAGVVIGAVLVLLIGFLVFSGGDDDKTASDGTVTVTSLGAPSSSSLVDTTLAGVPGEIFLEPRDGVGPTPFTPSVDQTPQELNQAASGRRLAPTAPFPSDTTEPPSVPGAIQPISGNQPGLYGGTRDRTSCDKEQLVSFLMENADKASAWAAVQQIQPGDIASYVAGLTPVLLRTDTRVTNYGFEDGKAPARQVVLEAGTAVLVDEFGVPRARCFCGNPLREPEPEPTPTYTGDTWEGFDPAAVTVVSPSPEPIDELVVVDIETAEPFTRPTGSEGASDAPAPPDVFDGPTTTELLPESTTSEVPPAGTDITATGSVISSSEFPGGDFPADLAIDGDPTTSWFSAGPRDDGVTVFGWVPAETLPVQIDSITIVSNELHPEFPTGYGFEEVTVDVSDAEFNIVFTETLSLSGTPDPTVVVTPNVRASFVSLTFRGSEALDCGGFAELIIIGSA
jgi:hypothetical protein